MKFPTILKNKDFFLLWLAQGVSNLGDNVTNLALIILINSITHSTSAIAVLVIAIALPKIIFGLIAGVYVDRLDRKKIMLASDTIRGLLVILFIFAALTKDVQLIYLVAFIQSAVGTFFNPARGALVQAIVPEDKYMEANSITQTIMVIGQFGGAALAGLLIGISGNYTLPFIIDSMTFLLSVGLVLFVDSRHAVVNKTVEHHFMHSLKEGLGLIAHDRVLLAIMVTLAMIMFCASPIQVLMVPLMNNLLHLSTTWFGLIQGGDTVGNIIGAVVLVGFASRIKPTKLFALCVFVFGFCIAALGAAFNLPYLFVVMFSFGLISVWFQTSIGTIMQESVDNKIMGRVMSLYEMIPGVTSVASLALVGVLGALIGIRQTFFLAGGIMALTGIYAWLILRRAKV